MPPRRHSYGVQVTWTGNQGTGTSGYRDYSRDHDVNADGPPTIACSSDPAFRGDQARWNPERLHAEASAKCFIANSVNFPVKHEPLVEPAT